MYVYIAVDKDTDKLLYAGEDQREAIESVQDCINDDPHSYIEFTVEDDGSVSVNYSGHFVITEVVI